MEYTNEVIVNLPVQRVIELMGNVENLKKWQPGLESFEPISGIPGQPGAKSRMKYKMGNRRVELVETILANNMPQEFTATYETKGVYNLIRNKFYPVDENTTRYVSESEFKLTGFMKLLGWLMPGTFKKQSQTYLDLFKTFAEKEGK